MSGRNSEFHSFYQSYSDADRTSPLLASIQKQQFEAKMASGRSPVIIDWEKVAYGCLGIALLAKGIYFWQK